MELNAQLEQAVYPPGEPRGARATPLRFALTDVAAFIRWGYFDLHNAIYKTPLRQAFSGWALKMRQLSSVDAVIVLFAAMMREHRWLYPEILRHVPILRAGLAAYSQDLQAGRPGPWMLLLAAAEGRDRLLRGPEENGAPLASYGASGVWVSVEALVALLRALQQKTAAQFN